eukprot:4378079-Alexandrium_andersonii.AAC.1
MVRCNGENELHEFVVDDTVLVHAGEQIRCEAEKLDTIREDFEFGMARARREALALERDTI